MQRDKYLKEWHFLICCLWKYLKRNGTIPKNTERIRPTIRTWHEKSAPVLGSVTRGTCSLLSLILPWRTMSLWWIFSPIIFHQSLDRWLSRASFLFSPPGREITISDKKWWVREWKLNPSSRYCAPLCSFSGAKTILMGLSGVSWTLWSSLQTPTASITLITLP